MDYIEQLITIGGPIVLLVWGYIKLHVSNEVSKVQNQILKDVGHCAEKLHEKINGRTDREEFNRAIARLQDAFDEVQATFIDVLRDIGHGEKRQ